MKIMIDIPKEFERDLQDKFNEFCNRVIADINFALDKQDPLLCGNYERETAEMFLKAFEKATVIPDNATNGDVLKAMFNPVQIIKYTPDVQVYFSDKYYRFFEMSWWNAPYEVEKWVNFAEELKDVFEDEVEEC